MFFLFTMYDIPKYCRQCVCLSGLFSKHLNSKAFVLSWVTYSILHIPLQYQVYPTFYQFHEHEETNVAFRPEQPEQPLSMFIFPYFT